VLALGLLYVVFNHERDVAERRRLRVERDAFLRQADSVRRVAEAPKTWTDSYGSTDFRVVTVCRDAQLLSQIEVTAPKSVLEALSGSSAYASLTAKLVDDAGFTVSKFSWGIGELTRVVSSTGAVEFLRGESRTDCTEKEYLRARDLRMEWLGVPDAVFRAHSPGNPFAKP
jgi:hypothetical protein